MSDREKDTSKKIRKKTVWSILLSAFVAVQFYFNFLVYHRFEVAPSMKEITVGLDSFRLQDPFKVKGFSVKGRVLTGPGGASIAEAKVILVANILQLQMSV